MSLKTNTLASAKNNIDIEDIKRVCYKLNINLGYVLFRIYSVLTELYLIYIIFTSLIYRLIEFDFKELFNELHYKLRMN